MGMIKSEAGQQTNVQTADFGRHGLGTEKARPKPAMARGSKRGKPGIQTAIQPVSRRFPAMERKEVAFTFFSSEAREVNVAGCFNDWEPGATPLKNMGDGKWSAFLKLRSGQYEYRFIVDGHWIEDPGASQRNANSHGGFNSILVVPLAVRTSIL